jgi:hypothetical protein
MYQIFVEMFQMIEVLEQDVLKAQEYLIKEDNPFRRRNLIRTFFALVEGSIFGLKQIALNTELSLSEGEISLLEEKSYELRDNGKVKANTKYLKLLPNFRFAVQTFARAFCPSYQLKVDNQGWECFRKAFDIRIKEKRFFQ